MPTLAAMRRARVVPLLAALLAALLALAADAATAGAQAGTPPATIAACYVPASGTIYRINTAESPAPGAPTKCLSTTHVQFSWNRQSFSDFEEVTAQGSPPADAGGRRSMRATCPPGKVAVGGYYSIFAASGNYAWGIVPVSSGTFADPLDPAAPPNVFFVLTVDAPGYASVPFFRVTVKCAKGP